MACEDDIVKRDLSGKMNPGNDGHPAVWCSITCTFSHLIHSHSIHLLTILTGLMVEIDTVTVDERVGAGGRIGK